MIDSHKDHTSIMKCKKYTHLFPSDEVKAKALLRSLQNYWHPDRNGYADASLVFAHINLIFDLKVNNSITYNTSKKFEYDFFEDVGYAIIYYSVGNILFLFKTETDLPDCFENNLKNIKSKLSATDSDKYRFYAKDLTIMHKSKTELLVSIHEAFVPLHLLEKYIDKYEDWRTSFWIVSRSYDLNMMFKGTELYYNGCVMQMCFIDVKNHIMLDLSALFFSTRQKLKYLDTWQIQFYPADCLKAKESDFKSSLHLIKAFGLRLFGDKRSTGNKFMAPKGIPCVIDHLGNFTGHDPLEAYKIWQKEISLKAFSVRKFHDIKVTYNDLLEYL